MILFIYDHTFEGLLTCIFDAYFRKTFPDSLLMEGEPLPLFYDEAIHIATDEEKAGRVWRGLQKKISKHALFCLTCCWLSELPKVDEMLFRYIRKAINSPHSIETNFADPDVLELAKIYKRVDGERVHLMQFVRFQKAADGTFFAAVEPQFNALPLAVDHFKDRFADQRWLIYDVKRLMMAGTAQVRRDPEVRVFRQFSLRSVWYHCLRMFWAPAGAWERKTPAESEDRPTGWR